MMRHAQNLTTSRFIHKPAGAGAGEGEGQEQGEVADHAGLADLSVS